MLAADMLDATGVTYELNVGHLALMKNLLKDLQPHDQRRVMTHLDKKDFKGLLDTLEEIGKPGFSNSLMALVQCRDLNEAFEIAGTIPEKERICQTIGLLDTSGVKYSFNFGIARGLDYYTGIVFEGFAGNLGAENQILGGGSYRLAQLFGGDDAASCGFAIGFDRVMVSLGEAHYQKDTVVGVLCTNDGRKRAFEVARILREAGIRSEMDLLDRGLGAQITHASKSADYVVVIGQREAESGNVTLKNLETGDQKTVDLATAIAEVRAHGASR
jgi:histidyl-tRNA synthetase